MEPVIPNLTPTQLDALRRMADERLESELIKSLFGIAMREADKLVQRQGADILGSVRWYVGRAYDDAIRQYAKTLRLGAWPDERAVDSKRQKWCGIPYIVDGDVPPGEAHLVWTVAKVRVPTPEPSK